MTDRFTNRVMGKLAALLLVLNLTAPFLYGFAWAGNESCAAPDCCAKGMSCHRHSKPSHDGAAKFSGNACPAGCTQLPALPGAAPALGASLLRFARPVAASASLSARPCATATERFAPFALFQRPPPTL